jgi:lipopolysaccharide/colanic/teichoic acid biosynthesis glycosyltransferase
MMIRRLLDFIFACLLMMVVAPFIVVVSIILLLQHKTNPFYLQKRGVVLEKDIFTIIKFKTMFNGSYKPHDAEEVFSKRGVSLSIDKFCIWLRKTGLDELPQLLNVIKGDMSFVGPRPLSTDDLIVIKETAPDFYTKRGALKSKPGITGLWQIIGNRKEGIKNLIELELDYERRKSPSYDLYLLWKTIPIVFFAGHSDAYLDENGIEQKLKDEKIAYGDGNLCAPAKTVFKNIHVIN